MASTDRTEAVVRPMTTADLALVLQWRNHPEVRRHMYSRHDISIDEHRQWFEREAVDARSHLLLLEIAGNPRGYIRFHEASTGVADWGFYAAPDAPTGTGTALGQAALEHAFSVLGLHKVCGQVLVRNERSVRFHERHGFTREGLLRAQIFDGQNYQDIVCFGLLEDEWRHRNQEVDDGP